MPIYQTSTYVQNAARRAARSTSTPACRTPPAPPWRSNVAQLEGGVSGHAFASGMSAIACLMTLLKAGDHVVVSRNVYGGTYRYFTRILERYGLTFSWVDTSDLAAVEAAMPAARRSWSTSRRRPTRSWTSPTSPPSRELAHARGALVAVDNTFLSPYLQRPARARARTSCVHSTTKFLNGHSDSIGGVLIAHDARRTREWFAFVQKSAGAILSPFDCFLVMRGIKTLAVRMERHEQNARAHRRLPGGATPRCSGCSIPGLPDHPGHEIQKRQASGFGAMITIEMGSFEAAKAMLDRVRVMSFAESLGGVESLISHPASMTHASIPPERRAELGLTEGMVRISVGIEDVEDLLADLDQALAAV